MKARIYKVLVNRVPAIRRKYQEARKEAVTRGARLLLFGKLLWWNLEYYLSGGRTQKTEICFTEKKKLLFEESKNFTGMSGEQLDRKSVV